MPLGVALAVPDRPRQHTPPARGILHSRRANPFVQIRYRAPHHPGLHRPPPPARADGGGTRRDRAPQWPPSTRPRREPSPAAPAGDTAPAGAAPARRDTETAGESDANNTANSRANAPGNR